MIFEEKKIASHWNSSSAKKKTVDFFKLFGFFKKIFCWAFTNPRWNCFEVAEFKALHTRLRLPNASILWPGIHTRSMEKYKIAVTARSYHYQISYKFMMCFDSIYIHAKWSGSGQLIKYIHNWTFIFHFFSGVNIKYMWIHLNLLFLLLQIWI